MGLLIKHPIREFTKFEKPNSEGGFYRSEEPPYTIGKLVKIKDAEDAIDFKSRQLQYYIGQVRGYKIFFVHAGFYEAPKTIVSDARVKQDIDDMCQWYRETAIPGKDSFNRYKI